MKKRTSTIPLEGTDLPRRLRELREQKFMTQADLAENAGLTYKTVHDLELGKRPVILEKTLMLLARGLQVQPQDLLEKYESPPLGVAGVGLRPLTIAAALLVSLLTVSGWFVFRSSVANATWEATDAELIGRDKYFGIEIWRFDAGCQVDYAQLAPWSDQELVFGVVQCDSRKENLFCVDRSTGEVKWETGPDLDSLLEAFGPEDVNAGKMRVRSVAPVDLKGNGIPELIVLFTHSIYYPFAICRIDRNGSLVGQYAHKGHLHDWVITDIDGDGKDEFLGAGNNNSKAYQGASYFILDDLHFSGASVDSLTDNWSSMPDSALIRIVIPNFPEPFASQLNDVRISSSHLELIKGQDGATLIRSYVGPFRPKAHHLIVVLDTQLNPIQSDIADDFRAHVNLNWPDSLKTDTGPTDAEWRREWLQATVRFEAGHRQQTLFERKNSTE